DRRLALLAGSGVPLGNHRLVVVVDPPRHHPGPGAQRAGHAELGQDRLADEVALVRQVVEEPGQLLLDLERDDLRLGGLAGGLTGHGRSPEGLGITKSYGVRPDRGKPARRAAVRKRPGPASGSRPGRW